MPGGPISGARCEAEGNAAARDVTRSRAVGQPVDEGIHGFGGPGSQRVRVSRGIVEGQSTPVCLPLAARRAFGYLGIS